MMIVLTKIFYCNSMEHEFKSYHSKTNWLNFVQGCRNLECCWNRTVLHDERHWRVFTIYRCSSLSWIHFSKKEGASEPKRRIRGNTKIGPVEAVTKMISKGRSSTMRVNCAWLVVRSNQLGPQNPNQIHGHPKQLSKILNQRKFHTWWVESFVELVQYQPVQFYSLLWYIGAKTSTRVRRRPSQSRIATNDEPHRKGAVERIVLDYSKPGEEKF